MATQDIYELGVSINGQQAVGGIKNVTSNLGVLGDTGAREMTKVESGILRLAGRFTGVGSEIRSLGAEFGGFGIAAAAAIGIAKQAVDDLKDAEKEAKDALDDWEQTLEGISAHSKVLVDRKQLQDARDELEAFQTQLNTLGSTTPRDIINQVTGANDKKLEGMIQRVANLSETLRLDEAAAAEWAKGVRTHLNQPTVDAANHFKELRTRLQEQVIALRDGELAAFEYGLTLDTKLKPAQRAQLIELERQKIAYRELQDAQEKAARKAEENARRHEEAARRMEEAYLQAIDRIGAAFGRLGGTFGHTIDIGASLYTGIRGVTKGEKH